MERYLALPHDWTITKSISTRGWHWHWICRLHTWHCTAGHMIEFMTIPRYNVQKGLF